ncbi:MAG: SPOR domain-containing protein, partial [bacterium]
KREKSADLRLTAAERRNSKRVAMKTRKKQISRRPSASPAAKAPAEEMVTVLIPKKEKAAVPGKGQTPKKEEHPPIFQARNSGRIKKGLLSAKSPALKRKLSSLLFPVKTKKDAKTPSERALEALKRRALADATPNHAAGPPQGEKVNPAKTARPVILLSKVKRRRAGWEKARALAPSLNPEPVPTKTARPVILLSKVRRRRAGWEKARVLVPSLNPESVPTHPGFAGVERNQRERPDNSEALLPALAGANGRKAEFGDSRPARVRYSLEGRYYILVGSYSGRRDALAQIEALRRNAYPAFIRDVDLGAKGRSYRVLVGRYQKLDEAAEEAEKLARTEKLTPRIFKEGDTDVPD